MIETKFTSRKRVWFACLLPAALLLVGATASRVDAKRIGVALAFNTGPSSQVLDLWTLCPDGQAVWAHARGWDEDNRIVCSASTRGQTTFRDCPSSAERHNGYLTAGGSVKGQTAPSSTWVQSITTTFGPFAAKGTYDPSCKPRWADIAVMGQ